MDSWYTSIPLMLQLSFWGVNAVETLNPKRKDFGKKFSDLKKKLGKTYNADKHQKKGYRQGYFGWRCTAKDSNLKVTIQKDSKLMLYLDNFLSSSEKISMKRYRKETKQSEQIDFWKGHRVFNFLYGMVDQATSWRTKAGGHKTKSSNW